MSYQLVDATARVKTLDATWETVDISGLTLKQIFDTYQGVYLKMTHFAYQAPIFLNLFLVRDELTPTQVAMTPQQWLTSINNATLPIVTKLPSPRERWVKYEDAFKAGYDVNLIAIGRHMDSQLPNGDKNDVFLTKSDVDFTAMWRYFMVSINGFFHRVALGPDGIYAIDGGRTHRLSNKNIAGLLSFREVAKMEQIPITPSMVTSVNPDQPLSAGAFIGLPSSVAGKTVLLVIGGYLHILDDTYQVVSDHLLKVDISNLNLADRYFHSQGKINLESLDIDTGSANSKQISVSSLYSDDVLRAYLSLPQSFVVVLDTTDVYLRKHRVDNTRLPGVYQQEGPFKRLPMFGTHGALLDYVAYKEDQKFVYNTNYVNEPHLMYRTTEWRTRVSIDDTQYPHRPWHLADGYCVEFGRFV